MIPEEVVEFTERTCIPAANTRGIATQGTANTGMIIADMTREEIAAAIQEAETEVEEEETEDETEYVKS
jgi:hypothetical protein